MGALQQIETAAQEIIKICQKERTNKADKEKLLKLQAEVFTNIENLVECEICGSITDLIVTMTIDPVTAKLCKDCGVAALEAGKIQKPTTRRRSARLRKKKESTVVAPEAGPGAEEGPATSPKQTDITDLYVEVEKQTKLKRTEIKRLHKIIQEIAGPMNLENTILYVKHEAELAKLKIEQKTLSKAVELLMAA
jgi:hypothetical protein